TIRLDNEVDRAAVDGPRLDGANDRHQSSSASNQARGPLADLATDDIEHEIDSADVFESVILEIDKLLRAEVERLLTVGDSAGADDVRAEFSGKLRYNRPDCARCTVREHALSRLQSAVVEQPLPCGEPRDRQACRRPEVDVARQRREVACFDGDVLRERAVAVPVREAEHSLS